MRLRGRRQQRPARLRVAHRERHDGRHGALDAGPPPVGPNPAHFGEGRDPGPASVPTCVGTSGGKVSAGCARASPGSAAAMDSRPRCRPASTTISPRRHTRSIFGRGPAKIQLSRSASPARPMKSGSSPCRDTRSAGRPAAIPASQPSAWAPPASARVEEGPARRGARPVGQHVAARARRGAGRIRAAAAPRRHRSRCWNPCRCRTGRPRRGSRGPGRCRRRGWPRSPGRGPRRRRVAASARGLVRRHVRRVDQAPALVDRQLVEQAVDRAPARPGDAVLDLADLFGDVDVDRPVPRQRRAPRDLVRRRRRAGECGATPTTASGEAPRGRRGAIEEPGEAVRVVEEAALARGRRARRRNRRGRRRRAAASGRCRSPPRPRRCGPPSRPTSA